MIEVKRKRIIALTPGEKEILDYIIAGLSAKQMADERGISVRSVQDLIQKVHKRLGTKNKLQTINEAARCEIIISSLTGKGPLRPKLTRRETVVLGLISLGLSNIEIGQRIGISADAAKQQSRNVRKKLGAKDRPEIAYKAAEWKLV